MTNELQKLNNGQFKVDIYTIFNEVSLSWKLGKMSQDALHCEDEN